MKGVSRMFKNITIINISEHNSYDNLRCLLPAACSSGHNAPLLSTFTRSTGGDLLTQAGMGPLLGQALWACLTRTYGYDATLDCYVTDGAAVVQWIGPLEKLKVGVPALFFQALCDPSVIARRKVGRCSGEGRGGGKQQSRWISSSCTLGYVMVSSCDGTRLFTPLSQSSPAGVTQTSRRPTSLRRTPTHTRVAASWLRFPSQHGLATTMFERQCCLG